jgi:LmbE family N-acetylglucosaminyl deacetylase
MKVLAISPHTDDIEVWASGLVIKHLKNGDEVRHICFSPSYESIPPEFDMDSTKTEFVKAQEKLGIKNFYLFDFPVRRFSDHRQDILEHLVTESKLFKPDIVITSSDVGIHQDHQVIGTESIRAFFNCSIIQYTDRRSISESNPNMFVVIPEDDWKLKKDAIQCYKSQLSKQDYYGMMSAISEFYSKLYGYERMEVFKVKKLIHR